MSKLSQIFSVGKNKENYFQYTGLKVIHGSNNIIDDHSGYIQKLDNKIIDLKRTYVKQDLLNSIMQTDFRQLVEQLNWAVQGSRPDIAFETAVAIIIKVFPNCSCTYKIFKSLVLASMRFSQQDMRMHNEETRNLLTKLIVVWMK